MREYFVNYLLAYLASVKLSKSRHSALDTNATSIKRYASLYISHRIGENIRRL
jgi:hypothetical protein